MIAAVGMAVLVLMPWPCPLSHSAAISSGQPHTAWQPPPALSASGPPHEQVKRGLEGALSCPCWEEQSLQKCPMNVWAHSNALHSTVTVCWQHACNSGILPQPLHSLHAFSGRRSKKFGVLLFSSHCSHALCIAKVCLRFPKIVKHYL